MKALCSSVLFPRLRRMALSLILAAGIVAPAWCQTPDDATDGVILVDTLAGANVAEKIENCIGIFAAGNDPAGVCDARAIAGGVIDRRINLNVDDLTVLLGSGTFTVTGDGSFRLSSDRTTLLGEGASTVLDIQGRTGTSAVVELFNPNTVIVDGASARHFKILGQRTGTLGVGGTLVRAVRTRGAIFKGLTLEGADKTAVNFTHSDNALVEGCVISDITTYGILVSGSSTQVRVLGNQISRAGLGASIQSGFGGIAVFGSAGNGPAPSFVHIEGNLVEDYGGGGIRVTRWQESIPEYVRIVGNRIDGIAPELINANDPTATRDGEGIGVSGNHIQILDNRVDRAYVNGIAVFLDGANSTIEDITIAQNRVSNSSQMPGVSNVHHGVGLLILDGKATNIVVGDNVLFDDQTTATQGYAVRLNPGSRTPSAAISNFFVHDNLSSGNRNTPSLSSEVTATAALLGNSP